MTTVLIALIIGAPTIRYRLEFDGFSMAVMEPIGLAGAGGICWLGWRAPGGWSARLKAAVADPLTRFVLGMVAALLVWSVVIGLWAGAIGGTPDGGWRSWMSDIRNWTLPSLIFCIALVGIHEGWRNWTRWIMAFGLAHTLLAIYQWSTNSFRPFAAPNAFYKATFTLDPMTNQPQLASFGTGLFSHPNELALYLVLSLLIGVGWWLGRPSLLKAAIVAVLLLGLATTYAKTSIGVGALGGATLLIHQRVRSNRAFTIAGGTTLLAAGGATCLAVSLLPRLWLATLGWRVGLWDAALGLLWHRPGALAIGGAMDDYARVAIYAQPHNLGIYLILAYGLLGVLWLGLLVWRIHTAAWQLRRGGALHREPLLAALWLGPWAFLAVGMLESLLLSIEWRMSLLLLVACFVGLRREALGGTANAA